MKEIYELYGENSDAVLDELRTRKEENETINYNYFYRSFGDFDLEEYVGKLPSPHEGEWFSLNNSLPD